MCKLDRVDGGYRILFFYYFSFSFQSDMIRQQYVDFGL